MIKDYINLYYIYKSKSNWINYVLIYNKKYITLNNNNDIGYKGI